jgi:hypothetical protein
VLAESTERVFGMILEKCQNVVQGKAGEGASRELCLRLGLLWCTVVLRWAGRRISTCMRLAACMT